MSGKLTYLNSGGAEHASMLLGKLDSRIASIDALSGSLFIVRQKNISEFTTSRAILHAQKQE